MKISYRNTKKDFKEVFYNLLSHQLKNSVVTFRWIYILLFITLLILGLLSTESLIIFLIILPYVPFILFNLESLIFKYFLYFHTNQISHRSYLNFIFEFLNLNLPITIFMFSMFSLNSLIENYSLFTVAIFCYLFVIIFLWPFIMMYVNFFTSQVTIEVQKESLQVDLDEILGVNSLNKKKFKVESCEIKRKKFSKSMFLYSTQTPKFALIIPSYAFSGEKDYDRFCDNFFDTEEIKN